MRDVLLTLHILTAILTVGWLAMQSMLLPRVIRNGPGQIAVLRFSERAARILGPASIVVFLLGVWLATRIGGDVWQQTWLNISMTLFILATVNSAVLIARTEKKALAKFEAGQSAPREARRIALLGGINVLFVIAIVYLMVAKPGA